MENKKGNSIVFVVIAILIVIILLLIVITFKFADNLKNKTEGFSKGIIEIEENIKRLNDSGSKIPVDNLVVYNKETLLTLLSKTKQKTLSAEISENGDDNATFYVLDVQKLGNPAESKGQKESGGDDIFVVAKPSLKVYYVAGIHIDGQSYYSLTKRLAKITNFDLDDKIIANIKENIGNNIITDTKSWTNALSIKLPMLIGDNKIILQVEDKKIDITNQILDKKFILKETEEITKDLIENVNSVVIKKIDKNGIILEEETVDISNVDFVPPELGISEEFFKVENKPTFNEVKIIPKDDKSGVDYVVFEYTKKKNSKGQIIDIKETTIIDKENIKLNLLNTGEKSKTGVIKLPLYISEFRLLAVDKAGNVSDYLEVKIPDAYVSNEAF